MKKTTEKKNVAAPAAPAWKHVRTNDPAVTPSPQQADPIDTACGWLARSSGLFVQAVYNRTKTWTVFVGREAPDNAIARDAAFSEAKHAIEGAFEIVNLFRERPLSVVVESREGVIESARAYVARRRALVDLHATRDGMNRAGVLMFGCGPDEAIDDVNEREVVVVDATLDA